MIAHSLHDETFGPAQQLHGATYVVDVTFFSERLNHCNIVIDIALAHKIINHVLEPMHYQNLDDKNEFNGKLTTTEFIARYIHDKIREKVAGYFQGKINVTLGESHIAWASYEGELE